MENKIIVLSVALLCQFFISSCSTVNNSQKPTLFIKDVDIDIQDKEKIINIVRTFYVGFPGPDGWVGTQAFVYHFTVPLGGFRTIINPMINGPDVDASQLYGYATFDDIKHEVKIQCRQVLFSNTDLYDLNHGGGPASKKMIGDEAIPINGIYNCSNPDLFK